MWVAHVETLMLIIGSLASLNAASISLLWANVINSSSLLVELLHQYSDVTRQLHTSKLTFWHGF